jgi:hypothetical protein
VEACFHLLFRPIVASTQIDGSEGSGDGLINHRPLVFVELHLLIAKSFNDYLALGSHSPLQLTEVWEFLRQSLSLLEVGVSLTCG